MTQSDHEKEQKLREKREQEMKDQQVAMDHGDTVRRQREEEEKAQKSGR